MSDKKETKQLTRENIVLCFKSARNVFENMLRNSVAPLEDRQRASMMCDVLRVDLLNMMNSNHYMPTFVPFGELKPKDGEEFMDYNERILKECHIHSWFLYEWEQARRKCHREEANRRLDNLFKTMPSHKPDAPDMSHCRGGVFYEGDDESKGGFWFPGGGYREGQEKPGWIKDLGEAVASAIDAAKRFDKQLTDRPEPPKPKKAS